MTGLKSMGASLALAAAFAFSGAATAQEIKLTLADQNSATAWGPTNGMQPWIKQVEQATKGRVKIEVFASQTLLKGPDTRSEEHTSELQSHSFISYAVFCLK